MASKVKAPDNIHTLYLKNFIPKEFPFGINSFSTLEKKGTIYVISWTKSPFTEKTVETFKHLLKTNLNDSDAYAIKSHVADLDCSKAEAYMKHAMQSNPALIFSTGSVCTNLANDMLLEADKSIPHVFAGVKNFSHLISSNSPNTTGVVGVTLTWEDQIKIFLDIKPTLSNALILANYSTSPSIKDDAEAISNILMKYGAKSKQLEVTSVADVIEHAFPHLMSGLYDTVFILRDGTAISCMSKLVKLCNKYTITIFSSYLDGVDQGAAFGIGLEEELFGVRSVKLVNKILKKGSNPRDLRVDFIEPDNFQIAINEENAPKQGIRLDKNLLFLLRNRKHIWSMRNF